VILPECFTKLRSIFLFVLTSLTLSSVVFAATDERGLTIGEKSRDSRTRVALVIGNDSYHFSPLKNSVNDARSMAATLRRLGFDVEEKTDLDYKEMNRSVDSFCQKLKSGGVGLFYYSGHGMQVDGNNYLIPVDSRIENESEVSYKSIDAGLVLAKMEQSGNGVNIIILDACRDNPFSWSIRSTNLCRAGMDVPKGAIVAYATTPGNTADDGEGMNGLYTAELVKALKTPGIPLEQVFKRTIKAVRKKSGSKQTPCFASNLEGEFYFDQPSSLTDIGGSQPRMLTDSEPRPSEECFLSASIFGDWFGEDGCLIVFSIGTNNRPGVRGRM